MELYLGVKLVHILSATLLFGTGLGTAFFMLRAYHGGDPNAMLSTAKTVVVADWLFTAPAVVLQVITGTWLTARLQIPYNSVWFVVVIGLFLLVGACWLPVVWIQIKIRDLLRLGGTIDECRSMMKFWIALGIPAFISVIVLFALMVYRPWINMTW